MAHGLIHHFFPHPDTGELQKDDYGDDLLGFYYQLVDDDEKPLCDMMGPYPTGEEAAAACDKAWLSNDY